MNGTETDVFEMTWDDWIEYGISKGFCSEQFCMTHNGPPMGEAEEQVLYANDGDLDAICVHVVRLGNVEDWNLDAASEIYEH